MSLQFSSLRPCEPEDLELLYTIENDRELWDTSNADAPYSRYAIKQYIAAAEPIQVCGELRLIIDAINEEGKKIAVGLVDLTDYSA
ncbi:acetyltransferase, GNAT family, partial [gut metagenome]